MNMMMKQGDLVNSRRMAQLEERVTMLENLVKSIQSDQRPKLGRPPKVQDERKTTDDNRVGN